RPLLPDSGVGRRAGGPVRAAHQWHVPGGQERPCHPVGPPGPRSGDELGGVGAILSLPVAEPARARWTLTGPRLPGLVDTIRQTPWKFRRRGSACADPHPWGSTMTPRYSLSSQAPSVSINSIPKVNGASLLARCAR